VTALVYARGLKGRPNRAMMRKKLDWDGPGAPHGLNRIEGPP